MARRRKVEAKASEKPQPKSSAVRKSSRQRAKKQLEEQKVNGDIISSNINNLQDYQDQNDDNSQESLKKANVVPKKPVRCKNLSDKEKVPAESGDSQGRENDSQDSVEIDSPLTVTIESQEEKHITDCESTLNEVIWPDDVIEETIICEEMEVETTEISQDCSIAQDGSVVLEQVLLMNDSNFEDKDVVEYTVIQNEDGTESVMVPSDSVEGVTSVSDSYKASSSYQMIEQGLSVLHMSEAEVAEQLVESEMVILSENDKTIDEPFCQFENNAKGESNADISVQECRSLRSVTKSGKGARTRKVVNTFEKTVKKYGESKKKRAENLGKKVISAEDKLLQSEIKEKPRNKKPDDLSVNVIEQGKVSNITTLIENSIVSTQEDNSTIVSNKMEPIEISDKCTGQSFQDKKIVNNSVILDQKCISSSTETKIEIPNRLPTKTKHLLFVNEEHSRDSETEVKIDSEDTKVSSSSENSNDTLLSSNSCRGSDFNVDNKTTLNQLNETDKKPGFRSRSGSTDTTGSESGSNSSGVRRSNRIRTIGLMKQRSRGRGLVTKPIDSIKSSIQQERDKLISNTPPIQEKDSIQNKDNLDVTETQSDKENNSNKTSSQDILTPLITTAGTTGYDSDSNKPVKVKSRWRRSSELEMSNSGSLSSSRPNLSFSNPPVVGVTSGNIPNSIQDTASKLPVGLLQDLKAADAQDTTKIVFLQNNMDMNTNDAMKMTNSSLANLSASAISKIIGAKIPLPMVPEVADREMEERLSQFEHLKENLYLTERFTSKETKRMVCDCFLTEEEFERGELGCGEDCLNRLLMIECGSRCVVGDRCTNKRFQNCEYANCEVFRTEKKGFGLRAITDLNAGEFIMEYVGEVVDPKDFRRRAKEYSKDKNRHYYFMALKSDQIIDATMKGNVSRFINHSCDPNAETQKWTVNGELRIGFFNKKFVAAGEEITFDYHFQRYGKEAQKCFCEATNCRGWIGDNPEDSKGKVEYTEDLEDTEDETEDETEDKEDIEDKEEKPTRQVRRKREEKKVAAHMEDEDLEEQIDKLCRSGLKNRAHTLTLSRLMVRSREIQHRSRLLKVIRSGEQACRRLFLDYHGLRLMWSYMMDVAGTATEEVQKFRLEVLKTLSTLPIPNRTMLIDSKVLSVIEKWSKQLYHSTSGDSPEDEQLKLKTNNEEMEIDSCEKNNSESTKDSSEVKKEVDLDIKREIKPEIVEPSLISELASNLLISWSNLKEVFRIPKKERIEQMKEHEREADRGYKEDVEKEARETPYDRYRIDRYNRNEADKRPDRRRGRDSPDFEYTRAKDKRALEERPNLVPVPRMTKFERRQLFAMKVAKEEEERQRRQQEESWQQHQTQCLALGLDPYTTAAFDPQSGYPLFFNPQLNQWQAYPIQAESAEHGQQQCTPVYMGTSQPMFSLPAGQPGTFGPVPPVAIGPSGLVQMQNGTTAPIYVEKLPDVEGLQTESESVAIPMGMQVGMPVGMQMPMPMQVGMPMPVPMSLAEPELEVIPAPPPPLDLPPKWKWARDKRGRIYYYHVKERVSQWLPPPPDHIAVQPDSSTTSESSDESSSSNEDEDDLDEPTEQSGESMEFDPSEVEVPVHTANPPDTKKRRDGLVQERIISPRREEDRVDHKKYKEIKEKLRRQKEKAKLKEQVEKLRKHRRSSKSKTHSKHSTSKFQPITSDMSPTMERRIKDTFRINMANVMVHFLNPYRKNDCKQGRITNTEDFKHLARKLTHFVLAKELKHCKSVDELECNENVKHKAKDFVRKYMSKFGAVYQKGTDED